MEGLERFDNFLITIVNETGGVEGLLHSMFSFLFRRTDFFYEMMPGEKMGFLPGEAERMVAGTFKYYQNEYFKKHPPKDPKLVQKKLEELRQKSAKEVPKNESANLSSEKTMIAPKSKNSQLDPTLTTTPVADSKPKTSPEQTPTPQAEKSTPQSSLPKVKTDEKFTSISTHNGGKNDKYSWSQGITDVVVQVDLKWKPTKSKELDVSLGNSSISVVHKSSKEVVLKGEFYDEIKVDDSTWSIEEGEKLILNLEKSKENIWKTVLKGDTEIDATKVDNTKKLEEFDDETQGALRKIVYEQNRKAQGLPTTEEEKQMDMLRKAWDAEGSPFKGTPFDPSKLNFTQPGQNMNNMLGMGPGSN